MSELFPIERLLSPFNDLKDVAYVRERLAKLPNDPLTHSQLNQLLQRSEFAAVSDGFFRFYFLSAPEEHSFALPPPPLDIEGIDRIMSREHLQWGIERFILDAAFFYGDFKTAFDKLRELSFEEIVDTFAERRIDTRWMIERGPMLPVKDIDVGDRYLVSELACKALDEPDAKTVSLTEGRLVDAFEASKDTPLPISRLLESILRDEDDFQARLGIPLALTDIAEVVVSSTDEIRTALADIITRFKAARRVALANTQVYLSICNELDVYVATSMREKADFIDTGEACSRIFGNAALDNLNLRWFDPTMSACRSHVDKGLVECLMVDQAQVLLLFAGEGDSWGKSAEAAMALQRGRPVIVLCPPTTKGLERERLFRDIHPLSRLTDFRHGVAVGAVITSNEELLPEILRRYFENEMAYQLEMTDTGVFVKEQLTGSVVRIVTSDRLIRSAFWNNFRQGA